ncbi:MAG: hypothetical protein HYY02_10870 [Chloroflexi bacterium]|nr:hypothetical protein [Chloroflexota bacterium]
MAPEQVGTFVSTITAPSTPGTYTEHLEALTEGLTWFNQVGISFLVKVTSGRSRKVIFVRGIMFGREQCDRWDTALEDMEKTFGTIRSQLTNISRAGFPLYKTEPVLAGLRAKGDFLAYSYSGAAIFCESDTRQHIEKSAGLLSQQIKQWRSEFPEVVFDIVAHSLGGVVALYWAGTEQDTPTLDSVHSIVTIDSPLGGAFGLRDWGQEVLGGGDAGDDLQDREVLGKVSQGATKRDVVMIGSSDDSIVPSSVAVIPGYWFRSLPENWSAGTSDAHGAPLRHTDAVEWIRWAISLDGPRWQRLTSTVPWQVQWLPMGTLPSVRVNTEASMPVTVTNLGTQPWPHRGDRPVHLSYHWQTLEGSEFIRDGRRTSLPFEVFSLGSASVMARMLAPDRPGRYRLVLDVVKEGETWLSWQGAQTYGLEVTVQR